ncbi:MAG: glycine cleavage system protein GcvH [Nitrososphaeria archaeon]
MSSYIVPEDLRYSKDHEWVRIEGSIAIVGITDYAVKSLHDIVYVSLPKIGSTIPKGLVAATVESIKAVSEVYNPISGTVIEVNKDLETSPEKINESPYEAGWLFKLNPTNLKEDIEKLFSSKQYLEYLSSLKK